MKIKQINWYGFNHEIVAAKFEGGLTYCNDLCVFGEYQPVAVYSVDHPNRKKSHKDFVLLQTTGEKEEQQVLIRGLDKKDMKKFAVQDAAHCLECGDVIYSVMRHHMNSCSCENISIDGGKDYTKMSMKRLSPYKLVRLNLITNKVLPVRKKGTKRG